MTPRNRLHLHGYGLGPDPALGLAPEARPVPSAAGPAARAGFGGPLAAAGWADDPTGVLALLEADVAQQAFLRGLVRAAVAEGGDRAQVLAETVARAAEVTRRVGYGPAARWAYVSWFALRCVSWLSPVR
jgi:hypothetical protein